MIEVIIRNPNLGVELARIEIENVSEDGEADYADYSVRFAVERFKSVGVHQRGIQNFPRTKYNVLALLRQVLNTLEPWELELDLDLPDNRNARAQHLLSLKPGNIFRRHH
jgi:hypothetical protein